MPRRTRRASARPARAPRRLDPRRGSQRTFLDEAGMPARLPHQIRSDLGHAGQLGDDLLDTAADRSFHRTAARGQRERDVDGAVLDRDVVDEAERDDVEANLRIEHGRERLVDRVAGRFIRVTHVGLLRAMPAMTNTSTSTPSTNAIAAPRVSAIEPRYVPVASPAQPATSKSPPVCATRSEYS